MKNTQKNLIILAVVIVILLVICAYAGLKKASQPAVTTVNQAMSTSTSATLTSSNITSTTTSQGTIVITAPLLLYSVTTDKKTYTQNEQINITLSILNNSAVARTFNFANGCQGTYTIAGFSMLQHMRCQPEASSFTIPAHGIANIPLVFYPSVSIIPVGTYPLYASMIGYGGATTTVTITK